MGLEAVDTTELAIHPVLKATHSLPIDVFNLVQRGDNITEESLNDAETQELEHAKQLGRNIRQSGQENPVKIAMSENGRPTLVQGYLRYLGCMWEGLEPDWTEATYPPTDTAVALHMLAENENAFETDPYLRAINTAIALDCWDAHAETYQQPVDSDGPTLGELADKLGRSKSTIHRWLSPVRQSQAVRDEFSNQLSEGILRTIESQTPDQASEYALAQAVAQSAEIETLDDLKTILDTVTHDLPEHASPSQIADRLHNRIRNPPRDTGSHTTSTSSPVDASSATSSSSAAASSAASGDSDSRASTTSGDAGGSSRRIAEYEFEQRKTESSPRSTQSTTAETPGSTTTEENDADAYQSTLDEFTLTIEEPALVDALAQDADAHGITTEEMIVRVVKTFYRERGSLAEPPERPLPN